MSFTVNKSAINEVRDQLSLDFADGEYLDVIGQNLGLEKHFFSYDDDIWRALIKVLALDYKQIASKFVDVLEILFGPKVTTFATLASSVAVGDTTCYLNDVTDLPQVGTLIFDEGLGTEETLEYRFIDRTENLVVLRTEFAEAHSAHEFTAEAGVLAIDVSGDVVVTSAAQFPLTGTFPVVLDKGLSTEASYTATNVTVGGENPTAPNTLTLSPSPFGLHPYSLPTPVSTDASLDYFPGSVSLSLEDSSQFPESGYIKLYSDTFFTVQTNNANAADKTIEVSDTLPNDFSLNGYAITMLSIGSTGITGVTRRIVSHTASVITIDEDFTGLPDFPKATDRLVVFPVVPYVANDYEQNTLSLLRPLSSAVDVVATNSAELIASTSPLSLAQVQTKGAGWDLIQSTPKLVELYIPVDIRDINDLRSASYIHDDDLIPGTPWTTGVTANPGDTTIEVNTANMPVSGTLDLDAGTEIVSYNKVSVELEEEAPTGSVSHAPAAGTSTLVCKDTNALPNTGLLLIDEGTPQAETLIYTNNDTGTGILTLAIATSYAHRVGTVVTDYSFINLTKPLVNTITAGDTVGMYDPQHAGTSTPLGDYNQDANTWPGPYVYDLLERAPTASLVPATNPTTILPGPSALAIDQSAGHDSLEVVSALAMDTGLTAPFLVSLGRENATVNSISMKAATESTVLLTALPGQNLINVASLLGFPPGSGYRVVLDEGTANQEVVLVISRDANYLRTQSPLVNLHTTSTPVRLMNDVLCLDANVAADHTGLVPIEERSTAVAAEKAYFNTPSYKPYLRYVKPLLDEATLADVTGLSVDGGIVLLNFGDGVLETSVPLSTGELAGNVNITFADTSSFPDTFPFEIVINPGSRTQEFLLVNSKSPTTLVAAAPGCDYDHATGEQVVFSPGGYEALTYDSIDTADLVFDPSIMLNYTHYPTESVIKSDAFSQPVGTPFFGTSYPLRMPVDLAAGLKYLVDLVRAAGVQVEIISER